MLIVKKEDFQNCFTMDEIINAIRESDQYQEICFRAIERSEYVETYVNTIAEHMFYENVDFIDNDYIY